MLRQLECHYPSGSLIEMQTWRILSHVIATPSEGERDNSYPSFSDLLAADLPVFDFILSWGFAKLKSDYSEKSLIFEICVANNSVMLCVAVSIKSFHN